MFIIFSIVDYYFETVGIPDSVAASLKDKIRAKGLDINFEDVKLGVIHGLVLTNPVLCDQNGKREILKAEKLKIGFTFSLFESYCFTFNSFEISQGALKVPFFPEAGKEGQLDIINIKNINATIDIDDNRIDVKHFTGSLSPFLFTAAGSFENMLLPDISDTSDSSDSSRKSFSIAPIIKKIPYVTRCRLYREILKFREGTFKTEKPECKIIFNIDSQDPINSFIKADVTSPAFTYGGFDIGYSHAILSLKGNKIHLQKLDMTLPLGGTINLTGNIDLFSNLITGKADIHVLPEELSKILQREKFNFPKYIKLHDKPVTLSVSLNNFSLSSMIFTGLLKVDIPAADIKNISVYNIKADLFINQNRISANHFSLNTDRNTLKGDFDYYPNSKTLNVHAQTLGAPTLIKHLHAENKELITDIINRFSYPEDPENVKIIFDMHAVFDDKSFYFISANLAMNDFKYNGIEFESISSNIKIDSNSLILIPRMIVQKKHSLATVSLAYDGSQRIKYNVSSKAFSSSSTKQNRLIAEIDGNAPGSDVLKCIFPDWTSEVLNLSEPVAIKGAGIIDFKDMTNTLFKIHIMDSTCYWQKFPINHLNCDLLFEGLDMKIINATGKVYNGDVKLKYLYNFDTLKGKIDLIVLDADFDPIAEYIGGELKNKDEGKISLIIRNDYHYDPNDNILMTGRGKLWIREADLWDIPIINEFGELSAKWTGKDWGNITKLDADLDFRKDHVYSGNIITDGTAIALRAKGSYYWHSNDFDFLIHADIMKGALPFNIVTKLFNPLSWLLETKVYRKDGKIKWEKITTAKRFFK